MRPQARNSYSNRLIMHRQKREKSASKDSGVIDYRALPTCARSCKILQISEGNCVPPAAPISNLLIYRNCVCQSEYLRSLHTNGEICHDVCSDKDDEVIHSYYNSMCEYPEPSKTKTSISMITASSAVVAATNASTLADNPTSLAPAPTATSKHGADGEHPWLQQNGKYVAAAAGITLIIVAASLIVAYYRRHNNYKRNLESEQLRSRSIALQPLTSPSTQAFRPGTPHDWPLKTRANSGMSSAAMRSPSVSSPLTPPTPSYGFGDSIRMYAEPNKEEGTFGTDDMGGSAKLVRSLSKTERLIRERIRMTGRPDIPISATPKVRR